MDNIESSVKQILNRCNDCPKAYDFTCSGANASRCNEEKEKQLQILSKEIKERQKHL